MEYMFLPPPDVNALVTMIRDLTNEVPVELVLKAFAILLARFAHKHMWIFYAMEFAADLLRRF